jgi:regulator of nonsense transcripts 2
LEQDKRNQEAYIKAGEIFEDRQHAYEKMIKAVEKLQSGVQSLADLLNLKVPDAPSALSISKTSLQIMDSGPAFGKDGDDMNTSGGIWEDDEERKFYEDILDLGLEVPPSILGIKANGEMEAAPAPEVLSPPTEALSLQDDETAIDEDADLQAEQLDGKHLEAEDDGEALLSGPAARLAAIFAALPEANNRTVIDKLAVDFAHLNSKPARKRCYKVIRLTGHVASSYSSRLTGRCFSFSAAFRKQGQIFYHTTRGSLPRSIDICRISVLDSSLL